MSLVARGLTRNPVVNPSDRLRKLTNVVSCGEGGRHLFGKKGDLFCVFWGTSEQRTCVLSTFQNTEQNKSFKTPFILKYEPNILSSWVGVRVSPRKIVIRKNGKRANEKSQQKAFENSYKPRRLHIRRSVP